MKRILRDGSDFPIQRKAEMVEHQGKQIPRFCSFAHEYLEMLRDDHDVEGFIPAGEGVILIAEMLDLTKDGAILMLCQPVEYIQKGEKQ